MARGSGPDSLVLPLRRVRNQAANESAHIVPMPSLPMVGSGKNMWQSPNVEGQR